APRGEQNFGEQSTGARRHRDEHLTLALFNRLFDRPIGFDLVRAKPWMLNWVLAEPVAVGVEVASQHFAQRVGRVESQNLARSVQLVAYVLKPEELAVGGVKERHTIAMEVEVALFSAPRIP